MKTEFAKTFDKDVNNIFDAKILCKIEQAIVNVEEAMMVQNIPKLKKLKGYKIHYRIRVGNYRIGVTIVGDLVTFERCLLRKDFYKYYP